MEYKAKSIVVHYNCTLNCVICYVESILITPHIHTYMKSYFIFQVLCIKCFIFVYAFLEVFWGDLYLFQSLLMFYKEVIFAFLFLIFIFFVWLSARCFLRKIICYSLGLVAKTWMKFEPRLLLSNVFNSLS